MKLFCWKVKNKNCSKIKRAGVNIVILLVLATVFAFSYAGGALQAFTNQSGLKAIYKGNTANNNVSFMFNVYWGTEYIEPILDILKENNVTATFFVGGVWASKNGELLNKILDNGCELANHGYQHKNPDKISQQENYDEINQTHQIVKGLTNFEMSLFAPPSGAYDENTLKVAESLGYTTIMWSKDTIDWRDEDSDLIYNRAIKNPSNGDLILMHPTEKTLEAIPKIIDFYKNLNYNLTTVSYNIAGIENA